MFEWSLLSAFPCTEHMSVLSTRYQLVLSPLYPLFPCIEHMSILPCIEFPCTEHMSILSTRYQLVLCSDNEFRLLAWSLLSTFFCTSSELTCKISPPGNTCLTSKLRSLEAQDSCVPVGLVCWHYYCMITADAIACMNILNHSLCRTAPSKGQAVAPNNNVHKNEHLDLGMYPRHVVGDGRIALFANAHPYMLWVNTDGVLPILVASYAEPHSHPCSRAAHVSISRRSPA